MYNKFYFLHVPKTAGRFLRKYILDPLKKELSNNNIEVLKNPQITDNPISSLHAGWNWNIDSDTYIVSCFRDPVEWACSYFVHNKYIDMQLLDLNNEAVLIKETDLDVNGSDVIKWLTENKFLQNYQSKNFLVGVMPGSTLRHDIVHYEDMNPEINKNFLLKRLKRVNLLFRQSDLKNMSYKVLVDKISNDLNVNIDMSSFDEKQEHRWDCNSCGGEVHYSNDASKILYKSLSDDDKNTIRSLMSIDVEIYNNDSIFWRDEGNG
jgi:hypothetical protein